MQESREKIGRYQRSLLLGLFLLLVVVIGWVRQLTGPEYALSFFYLLPIVAVTWLAGGAWGSAAALVSILSWLLADLAMIDRFTHTYVPWVNEAFRLSVFLFIVFVIARYKKVLDRHREMAMLDPLTRAANRRAFFHLAGTEIGRSRRYRHPFSVMVIDVDDFKRINDHFGHHVGDRLLIAVVRTIKQHVRAIDIVARFGGDEFVVLLIRTGEKAAGSISRKLRAQLIAAMRARQWDVTFSIGVATYCTVPDSVDETIRAADALMYQVKHEGKDGIRQAVMTADPEAGVAESDTGTHGGGGDA